MYSFKISVKCQPNFAYKTKVLHERQTVTKWVTVAVSRSQCENGGFLVVAEIRDIFRDNFSEIG